MKRLEELRDDLKAAGFDDTELVLDRANPPNGDRTWAADDKSYYYVEHSDFNIFFFPRVGDKSGVSLEIKHLMEQGIETQRNSILVVEMSTHLEDPLSSITSLLREAPQFSRLNVVKIPVRRDDLLLEYARGFLERRLIEQGRYTAAD